MRFDGVLKSWNDERGFGFIEPVQGGDPVFVHIKAFPAGTGRPSPGQALTFELEVGPNGKKRAHAVQYPPRASAARVQRSPVPRDRARGAAPSWTAPRALAIPLFGALCLWVGYRWSIAKPVMLLYAGASLVAFLAYGFDKAAAKRGDWRTPESTLHLLGLIGGWPGALLAQQWLRHKTAKPSFIAVFWLTVIVNVLAFVAWHALGTSVLMAR